MATVPARHARDPNLWTVEQFHDFYTTRPDEERWQLVDGLPMMMTPSTFLHQKIGKNLLLLLDNFFDASRPDLAAYYELGIQIPGVDDFNPTPDVLVIRADAVFERCAESFLLVAEVISPSNTAEMIERKLELYRDHPDNLYCLTVDQDSVHATLFARENDWVRRDFHALDDGLRLPAFDFEATLAEVYKGTTLGR